MPGQFRFLLTSTEQLTTWTRTLSRAQSLLVPGPFLVVHQVGLPAPLNEISEIASRHGLKVIEDAAALSAAEYDGRRVGLPYSSMACFSFHPRKVLTTGEGE